MFGKNAPTGKAFPVGAAARERVAVAVNAELTMLYWRIGDRINKEILEAKFRQAIEMARNRLAMVKERGQ